MKQQYGVDAMPETAENVAEDYQVARKDQDAFALRSQQRAAQGAGGGIFREEIEPVIVPGGKAGPITVDKDEHLRPDTTLGGARQAEAVRAQSRHHHRRQCVRRQRRRRGDDHRVGGGGEEARADAVRAHHRHGVGRRAAARHGHRPGAVDAEADGALRAEDRRLRRDRAERGVRLAGAGVPAPARARRRCRARQSERRRDRARPSARHVGRAARAHRGASDGEAGRQARARHMCVGVGQGVSLAIERV